MIGRGAEACVTLETYFGMSAVRKRRVPKGYRHPKLDSKLISIRIRNEARMLRDARSAGVLTPVVYDIDVVDGSIVMEFMEGESMKQALDSGNGGKEFCESMGMSLGLLHSAGISHGDPTTSNMIVSDGKVCFIDLSMGTSPAGAEEMGVDLHLLERAMESAHPNAPWAYESTLVGYRKTMAGADEVIEKVAEIRSRGRYT